MDLSKMVSQSLRHNMKINESVVIHIVPMAEQRLFMCFSVCTEYSVFRTMYGVDSHTLYAIVCQ